MGEQSGGLGKNKKRKTETENIDSPSKIPAKFTRNARGLFCDYNHIYIEEDKKDYPVLLSHMALADGSIPKMDILKANKLLKNVNGVAYVKQIGLALLKVVFATKTDANNFILNKVSLEKSGWIARIPYDRLESLGVIRAPPELSEEELLEQLQSSSTIIGVKRFVKRTASEMLPTQTVLITFLGSVPPDHVTYDRIWFDVRPYVKPVRQCYTCYKFGHGKGSCKSKQMCSICAEQHSFKECTSEIKKCINCKKSDHIAVSPACPVKKAKINEVKNQILGKTTFATVAAKPVPPPSAFPPHKPLSTGPRHRAALSEILNSDCIITAITKTILDILKQKDSSENNSLAICSKTIKELLITNFAT